MPKDRTKSKETQPHPPNQFGRDEMNLAEFPITVLAERGPQREQADMLRFTNQHGTLTITASAHYGMPNSLDTDVIVGMIYLTKIRNNFTDPKINFSRYELIKLLNWGDESSSYARLDESFNRWMGVTLVYDGCWWNNRLKRFTDNKMHIIDNVEIIDQDARRDAYAHGQGNLPLSYFIWNRVFVESCQADNLRQLDLDIYFSLKSAIAKRLYRFLGKRFYLQPDCKFNLKTLAFEHVGLSRNYSAAKIKEKLAKPLEELESINFLMPLSREERYSQLGRGEWNIRLASSSRTLDVPSQATIKPLPAPTASESSLTSVLCGRGIAEKTAVGLVKKYPDSKIHEAIDILESLPKKKREKIEDEAAWLIAAITSEEGYVPPKGFKTATQRQQEKDAQEAIERENAEAARRQQAEKEQERKVRAEVNDYLKRMSPEDQTALAARLLAANPETKANYEAPHMAAFRETFLSILVREHLEQRARDGTLNKPDENALPCPEDPHQSV